MKQFSVIHDIGKMFEFLKVIVVLLFVIGEVNGTLIPNGTVSLDCGSRQTFTCSVTGGAAAQWNIDRLIGINAVGTNGGAAASNNDRIINPLANGVSSSTITIIGFNASDNGGTIECAGDDGVTSTVDGMAIISVGLPSCPTNFSANRDGDFTSATVTYQLATPPPVTSTAVTYCPTSSPNCGNNLTCSASPCNISGLNACEDYQLTVFPSNNCGSATGCTGNSVNVTSQGIAACANNVTATRSGDFTNATIEWQETTPPKVTFTTVTYSPMLPNGENSSICMNSPCTISGLDPCMGYVFEVIPNNDCGNTTECIGNSAVANSQGVPSCPSNTKSIYSDSNRNKATVTWQQPPNTLPVTFTTVTYCPTSSPNCGDNTTCTTTGTCTISGLDSGTEYQFTVIPNNNCGSPTGCTGNMATAARAESLLVLLALLALLLIPLMYPLGVLIAWRCCYKDKSYCEVFWCCWCCGCCAGGKSGRNSTEPMKSPTGDDDAQDKTGQKEEKLTYAALEFSEQAGSTGEKKVRSHEEPVQYAAVDHA